MNHNPIRLSYIIQIGYHNTFLKYSFGVESPHGGFEEAKPTEKAKPAEEAKPSAEAPDEKAKQRKRRI